MLVDRDRGGLCGDGEQRVRRRGDGGAGDFSLRRRTGAYVRFCGTPNPFYN